ncbi:MAG TPA: hypothetical protein VJH90_03515 [archaeon]|nr:hypothetical protein [archaeon]
MECKLCTIDHRPEEVVLYRDEKVTIIETKNKKGHKQRIMVVVNKHGKDIPKELEDYAKAKLREIGKKEFSHVPLFCIMQDLYSTIPGHWHVIASDFRGEDVEQMILTPFEIVKVDERFGENLRGPTYS